MCSNLMHATSVGAHQEVFRIEGPLPKCLQLIRLVFVDPFESLDTFRLIAVVELHNLGQNLWGERGVPILEVFEQCLLSISRDTPVLCTVIRVESVSPVRRMCNKVHHNRWQ